MNINIARIKKAIWTYKQPLTKLPTNDKATVSDLFVWRKSGNWNTFFELIDIPGLFNSEESFDDNYVEIYFFEANGQLYRKERLIAHKNKRITIDLSVFLAGAKGEYGTFCVFHEKIPAPVLENGSYIAERGYVGFAYKGTKLRTYTHGNLDAISLADGMLTLLEARSLFRREYRLQYELNGPAYYELGIVNPTDKKTTISCIVYSLDNNQIDEITADLPPGGVHIFPVKVGSLQSARIVIRSRLIMARPLVFRTYKNLLDVFHG